MKPSSLLCVSLFLLPALSAAAEAVREPNPYRSAFERAYAAHPSVPRGILEAIAWTRTRITHVVPAAEPPSCIGLPPQYGVMGLIADGKGYFASTLALVAEKSGMRARDIAANPRDNIFAFARAFAILQREMGVRSRTVEANIPVIMRLCELPVGDEVQQFARDSYLYSLLSLFSDTLFLRGTGLAPQRIELQKIFGKDRLRLLSAPAVRIRDDGVYGPGNMRYGNNQPPSPFACPPDPDYPPALWNPADPSNYSSRSGTPVSAVTVHTVQGSYAGAISWFKNPSSNVSAHYVIRSSDGQVTQMVCEYLKAWHVGTENPYTIGIEHEGYVSNPSWYTTAMYQSSADLCRDIVNSGYGINPKRTGFWPWLATTYYNQSGIPGSCTKIKGHMHFPNQTHTDPGQYWDWDYYYKLINDPPPVTTLTACSGAFYDNGGSGGNYTDDVRSLTVIQPPNASSVTLIFSAFDLENTWDYLYIYDGPDVWAPLIGYYTGTAGPGTVTSSGGAIAVEFRSDCATTAPGWAATWSCAISNPGPANLQVYPPPCSGGNYTTSFSWQNSGSGWWLDISTDANFATYWNKPVDWLTSTSAPAGFNDPFGLGALSLQPGITYYWRIWDGSAHTGGASFTVNTCPDVTAPTTTIGATANWETGNFPLSFTDADSGGSGLCYAFYQVLEYNGSEWRGNAGNGFFNDNFTTAIHPDWTVSTGTWSINASHLYQSDESQNNTNIYAPLVQTGAEVYLYHWQALFETGVSANRRQGLHFFCDNPSLPNRGNSYFAFFRADNKKAQIYKVVNDTFYLMTNDTCVINDNVWYDWKVIYNPSTGVISAWQDDALVSTWTDPSPYTSGNSISLRTGNALVLFDDLKAYRARGTAVTVTAGPGPANDVRYENPNPSTPSCRIKSIAVDCAGNWSAAATRNVNIDWTPPSAVTVNDGPGADVDTLCSLSGLSGNWSPSSDPNSGITRYRYAVGTAPGDSNVLVWTDNGLNTGFSQVGLPLQQGQAYFTSVLPENGAGLTPPGVSFSDGQTPYIPTVVITADTTQLTLPDSVINFTDLTAGAVAWAWSFPGGNPSASALQNPVVYYTAAGSYDVSLTVTNAQGCSSTLVKTGWIIVSSPPPAPPVAGFTGTPASGCAPLTVNFSDASANVPTSWSWSFPGGDITSSTLANPTVTYTAPGTYDVTLVASNPWGSDTAFFSGYITLYPLPEAMAGNDLFICAGEPANLSVSGGASYLWSTGHTDSAFTLYPALTTTYTVAAQANGCTGPADSVTVYVSPAPAGSVTSPQTICAGDTAILSASGGDAYLWSTGDTTPSIAVTWTTVPSDFTVIISKAGCMEKDTLTTSVTTLQQPEADFSVSDTLLYLPNAIATFTNASSAATAFLWDFGDSNTSADINPWHQYAAAGLYGVVLVASNGACPDDTLIKANLIRVLADTALGATELAGGNAVRVYPNPNEGVFTVEFNLAETNGRSSLLYIYDVLGREVYKSEVISHKSQVISHKSQVLRREFEIDLSGQPAGIYHLSVRLRLPDEQVMAGGWIFNTRVMVETP